MHGSAQGPLSPGGYPVGSLSHLRCPKTKRYRARRLASLVAQAASPASRPPRLRSASPNTSPRQPHRLAGLLTKASYLPRGLPDPATSSADRSTQQGPLSRDRCPVGPLSDLRCPSPVELVLQDNLVFQIKLVPLLPSTPNNRFRMMVAAWSCFPSLQIIDSG